MLLVINKDHFKKLVSPLFPMELFPAHLCTGSCCCALCSTHSFSHLSRARVHLPCLCYHSHLPDKLPGTQRLPAGGKWAWAASWLGSKDGGAGQGLFPHSCLLLCCMEASHGVTGSCYITPRQTGCANSTSTSGPYASTPFLPLSSAEIL